MLAANLACAECKNEEILMVGNDTLCINCVANCKFCYFCLNRAIDTPINGVYTCAECVSCAKNLIDIADKLPKTNVDAANKLIKMKLSGMVRLTVDDKLKREGVCTISIYAIIISVVDDFKKFVLNGSTTADAERVRLCNMREDLICSMINSVDDNESNQNFKLAIQQAREISVNSDWTNGIIEIMCRYKKN
jgi:hypothetical protein